MKEGEHPFWFLFPDEYPNPIWNAHFEEVNFQIRQLFKAGKLLDAFILTIQGQMEFYTFERPPGNSCFTHWVLEIDFLRLVKTYPDFRYIYAQCRQYRPTQEMLDHLISMREGKHLPLTQEQKTEIQQRFYNEVLQGERHIDRFIEIFGDEDVVSNTCRN